MKKLYSDGMGTFLNVAKCCDDDNFVTFKIEEEQEDNTYKDVNISLYKDEVKDLIKDLETLIDLNTENKPKTTPYIVSVSYFPMVFGKDEVFKLKTTMSKEEIYSKVLKKKESENEHFEVTVLVETVEEYLEDIEYKEI